jgi:hypothetical protein
MFILSINFILFAYFTIIIHWCFSYSSVFSLLYLGQTFLQLCFIYHLPLLGLCIFFSVFPVIAIFDTLKGITLPSMDNPWPCYYASRFQQMFCAVSTFCLLKRICGTKTRESSMRKVKTVVCGAVQFVHFTPYIIGIIQWRRDLW